MKGNAAMEPHDVTTRLYLNFDNERWIYGSEVAERIQSTLERHLANCAGESTIKRRNQRIYDIHGAGGMKLCSETNIVLVCNIPSLVRVMRLPTYSFRQLLPFSENEALLFVAWELTQEHTLNLSERFRPTLNGSSNGWKNK